jgi:hypothetical protein
MGAIHSNYTWYVYSRDFITDSWNKKPIYTFEKENLGIFKHFVWLFALQDSSYKNLKAIYLYQGSTRYIKAEIIKPVTDAYYKLEMHFKNEELANAWDVVEESIVTHDVLWKEDDFNKHYVPLDTEQNWIRRWQLVKPIPDTKPGLPKLTLIEYIKTTIHQ